MVFCQIFFGIKTWNIFQDRISIWKLKFPLDKIDWIGYLLNQGFSTFWYARTPKSEFHPSAYPQIRIVSSSRTPKSKLLPKRASFEQFFLNFAYPLLASHVPLGVRVPQVENRCIVLTMIGISNSNKTCYQNGCQSRTDACI